ncbi:hypothetical protein ACFCZV_24410 [Streptomyces hydrogenans]|uniref:hypothetical protein n=1 Tax=Streptomyces hydrogenans TaxID=1873719 RepID=UPI0035D931FD
MHDEQSAEGPALTKLRRRLDAGRALTRLNQTQLAKQAGLGRTTVSQALSPRGGVPSVDTVAALARVLRLPVGELLELQRAAAEESGATTGQEVGPGRPISQWDPHELEVHPAGSGDAASSPAMAAVRALPGYVSREHDRVLDDAVQDAAAGRSLIVVLVGTSSTGKTRACWEAIQPLAAKGWRLWHPFDPTRAEAALEDLHHVGPRTVVWLNEAQHYLGDRAAGERIAAAVHRLLVDEERGPVLVLGTLWPEYAAEYAALPTPGGQDPYSRVRELLAGRTLAVPDTFDTVALAMAAVLAENGDRLLADALTRARDGGRVTQDLAGAPELLRRYAQSSPAARALLEVAMDARRLGVGLHLSQAFLTDAASDYLTDTDYDQLTDDWAERAYAELALLGHGKQAPLRRTIPRPPRRPLTPTASAGTAASLPAGPVFRLADYLEQHGRTTRNHLCPPASFWHAAHTHLTHPDDLTNLAKAAENRHRLQWAYYLQNQVADRGSTDALQEPARMRQETGDRPGAEPLAQQDDMFSLSELARTREEAGDLEGAENLYRQAADRGNSFALYELARMRMEAGDRQTAESLFRQCADRGNVNGLARLALMQEEVGDLEGAENLYRQAADRGYPFAMARLIELGEAAGDRESAETLARQIADRGDTYVPYDRVGMLEVLRMLWPYGLEPDGMPTPPWQPPVSALFDR